MGFSLIKSRLPSSSLLFLCAVVTCAYSVDASAGTICKYANSWAPSVASYFCDPPPPPAPPPPPPPGYDSSGQVQPPPAAALPPDLPPAPAPAAPKYSNSGSSSSVTTVSDGDIKMPSKIPGNNSGPDVAPPDIQLPQDNTQINNVLGSVNTSQPHVVLASPPPTNTITINNNTNNSMNAAVAQAVQSCKQSFTQATQDCKQGGTASQMAQAAQMGGGQLAAGSGAYAACKAMKAQSFLAMGSAATVYEACQHSISNCTSSCDPSNFADLNNPQSPSYAPATYKDIASNSSSCSDLSGQVKQSLGASLAMAGGAYGQAKNCDAIIAAFESGGCSGANAANNPGCPEQYCLTHKSEAQCTSFAEMCGDPRMKGNPICVGANGGASLGQNAMSGSNMDGLGGDVGNGAYAGYQNSHSGVDGAGDSGNRGSGIGMLSGGAYPGGGGSANGGGAAGKDIPGQPGVSFGGSSAAGAVIYGNADPSNRGRNEKDDFDLSAFFPKDKAAASRFPASVNPLLSYGITSAGDLSNFEKVTRRMNLKRKSLLP